MIIRRRTYGGDSRTVVENYGYLMKNMEGNSTDTYDNVYLDTKNVYNNPVYTLYGADTRIGELPSSFILQGNNEPNKKTINGTQVYVQKSYTDGATIMVLVGDRVLISTDEGVTWSQLFLLSISYSGTGRVLIGMYLYFNSSYVFVLYNTTPTSSSSFGYNTSLRIMCAVYNRSNHSITYKQITTITGGCFEGMYGPGTKISPDGIVCIRLSYYSSLNLEYPHDLSGYVHFLTVHLPAIATNSNNNSWFKDTSYKVILTFNNLNVTFPNINDAVTKWVYDGSTYGCFMNSSSMLHLGEPKVNGSYQYRSNVFKLSITASASALSSVSLSVVHSETDSSAIAYLFSEHCGKEISNKILVLNENASLEIRDTNWTLLKSLGTINDALLKLYGNEYAPLFYTNVQNHYSPYLLGGIGNNITPDGKYYVLFTTTGKNNSGFVLFIHATKYYVMSGSPFLEWGTERNNNYIHYMIPRATLGYTGSHGGSSSHIASPPDSVNLNSEWQNSSISYGTGYTTYESNAHRGEDYGVATMYFTPSINKTVYIKNDSEVCCDYVTVYNGSTVILSGQSETSWIAVSLTAGILYTIQYKKDLNTNNGEDRGYIAIPN